MYYTLKDHQGNLAATVHGSTVERLSYDPWGRRRNTTDFGYDNIAYTFDRGYTLHEHYEEFDLINMNGRLCDPILGRMLSPDIVVQNEQNSQAYNRYSYCFNNPLRFTDPSGYVVDEWEIDAYGRIINHKKDKTQDVFYENGVLHKTTSEPGMTHLLENKLLYGYTIRELNHSHPLSSKVSSADERFAKQVKGIQKKRGYHIPKFYIYDVSNKKYIPYGL